MTPLSKIHMTQCFRLLPCSRNFMIYTCTNLICLAPTVHYRKFLHRQHVAGLHSCGGPSVAYIAKGPRVIGSRVNPCHNTCIWHVTDRKKFQSTGLRQPPTAQYSYCILWKLVNWFKRNTQVHVHSYSHTCTHTIPCFFPPTQSASKDHSDCSAIQMEQPGNCWMDFHHI